ncbi:hypothetical protein EUTSA_v10005105mg [Eutrema salsugineum]|uniref:Uncharacterized protein n=1 Tax=Eutrema salsugineum TaxID=72664 RepID=V4KTA9_EUTSA|nr:hypothetical protein EUTSA_v10005105mg [Eutrema salsugineum]
MQPCYKLKLAAKRIIFGRKPIYQDPRISVWYLLPQYSVMYLSLKLFYKFSIIYLDDEYPRISKCFKTSMLKEVPSRVKSLQYKPIHSSMPKRSERNIDQTDKEVFTYLRSTKVNEVTGFRLRHIRTDIFVAQIKNSF